MTAFAIEFDRVTLARGRRTVLADVTATIRSGEFIGVFGPNGAGKTTLLQAILGLVRLEAGELRVFGRAPAHGNPHVGYLPQQHAPLVDVRLLGREFVASALHGWRWGVPFAGREGTREIDRVLTVVQAQDLALRPIAELSGGEQQRLLLAQALIGAPKLLLLDEPMLGLDPHFQERIVALVCEVQRTDGITVLFTAHELNPLLRVMDRVLYLGHGIAAIGTVDEVVTGEVLSRLYGTAIDVLRVRDTVVVVSREGSVESDAHHHHA